MAKLNLAECILLEAAGELSPPARKHLYAYIKRHPEALAQLESARAHLAALDSAPQKPLSADMMRLVPAALKACVQRRVDRLAREKQADKRWKLVYYAVTAVSAAAAVLVIVAGIYNLHVAENQKREREMMASINTAADRLAIFSDSPTQYDQDLAEVGSSIAQLQVQDATPAAAIGGSRDMTGLLEALATVPPQSDDDPTTGESGAI